jgi:hypothetical protein
LRRLQTGLHAVAGQSAVVDLPFLPRAQARRLEHTARSLAQTQAPDTLKARKEEMALGMQLRAQQRLRSGESG